MEVWLFGTWDCFAGLNENNKMKKSSVEEMQRWVKSRSFIVGEGIESELSHRLGPWYGLTPIV